MSIKLSVKKALSDGTLVAGRDTTNCKAIAPNLGYDLEARF